MGDAMITIQVKRFLELIKIETRVDILVDMLGRDEFVSMETILRIIGTEKAIEVADRIHRKDKEMSFEETPEDKEVVNYESSN